MFIFRIFLRLQLKVLAKLAIRKHKMELVVISGWYGTEVAKEVVYEILSTKLRVRKNIKEVWWDFTIPLSILGYKDRKRSFLQWWWLLYRAWTYIFWGKSNPHTLILSVDTNVESIVKYWSSFIKPDILVILNDEENKLIIEKLVDNVDPEKGLVIYNPEKIRKELGKQLKKYQKLTFGEDKSNDLIIKSQNKNYELTYKQKKIKLKDKDLKGYSNLVVGGVVAAALSKEIPLEEIGFGVLKFQAPARLLTKIKSNLKNIEL